MVSGGGGVGWGCVVGEGNGVVGGMMEQWGGGAGICRLWMKMFYRNSKRRTSPLHALTPVLPSLGRSDQPKF